MTPKKSPTRSSRAVSPKTHASEIAPGVFVGGWKDAEGFVGARICVLDESPDETLPGMTHVPIYDGEKDRALPRNLDKVAEMAIAARGRNEPVILFCGHGIRRGSLAGAWYLHRAENLPLDQAFDRVAAVRPKIERPRDWIGNTSDLDQV